jgi:hypothetical protein
MEKFKFRVSSPEDAVLQVVKPDNSKPVVIMSVPLQEVTASGNRYVEDFPNGQRITLDVMLIEQGVFGVQVIFTPLGVSAPSKNKQTVKGEKANRKAAGTGMNFQMMPELVYGVLSTRNWAFAPVLIFCMLIIAGSMTYVVGDAISATRSGKRFRHTETTITPSEGSLTTVVANPNTGTNGTATNANSGTTASNTAGEQVTTPDTKWQSEIAPLGVGQIASVTVKGSPGFPGSRQAPKSCPAGKQGALEELITVMKPKDKELNPAILKTVYVEMDKSAKPNRDEAFHNMFVDALETGSTVKNEERRQEANTILSLRFAAGDKGQSVVLAELCDQNGKILLRDFVECKSRPNASQETILNEAAQQLVSKLDERMRSAPQIAQCEIQPR